METQLGREAAEDAARVRPGGAPADLALDAFASAREPTRLELLDSNHFAVYSDAEVMAQAANAAADFFSEHLAVRRPLATATSLG